jgi:hypothetical protein
VVKPGFALRLSLSLVGLFLAGLILSLQPAPVQAQTYVPNTISLSSNSGATGSLLTIRGKVNQPYATGWIVTMFLGTARDLISIMSMGTAVVGPDGSFTWTGPVPRGGTFRAGDGPGQPQQKTLTKGSKVYISYGLPPALDSDFAEFTITEATNGPITSGDPFEMINRWNRTDKQVLDGKVSRSLLWGPNFNIFLEPYKEGPDGWRWVGYFDKARMEVTRPNGTRSDPYYVTNGLLVKELATGQLQLGDNEFQNKGAAEVPAAGDFSDANKTPRFSAYGAILGRNDNQNNGVITQTLGSTGLLASDPALTRYNVTATNFVSDTGHYIASPFWAYLNSTGLLINDRYEEVQGRIFDPLFSATGFPIAEAYWTKTVVAGVEKDVLVQLFERRVLTFTPSNPAAFQVEMGNVGLQYYVWRYGG